MADFDKIKLLLVRLVEQLTDRFFLSGHFPCEVVAQNPDGSLEVKPDDPARFGAGLSRVPLRLGLPGCSAKVRKGSRVLLSFEAFDPRRPVATLWDTATVEELRIVTDTKVVIESPKVVLGGEDGTEKRVAREGDLVEVVITPALPIAGVVVGGPTSGTLTIAQSLLGIIISASTKVSAAD